MKIKLFNQTLFILMVIVVFTFSCGTTEKVVNVEEAKKEIETDAPIVERNKAKQDIEWAKEVDAAKYAPKKLREAESKFDEGQDLIDLKKKNPNNIKAKEKYLEASRKAKEAYDQSIQLYTAQLIKETDDIIEQERKLGKKPQKIAQAQAMNKDAREKFKSGQYESAKELTLEAREIAINSSKAISVSKNTDQSFITYTVKDSPDENLWNISKRNLNNPLRWIEIYNFNIDEIKNPNILYPKQILKIDTTSSTIDEFLFNNETSQGNENTYVVPYRLAKQITLWDIAQEKLGDGNRWEELYELNKDSIDDPNIIYPGQKINLPE